MDEQTLALYEQLVNDDDERALSMLAESVTAESMNELKVALREALGNVGDLERAYAVCVEAAKTNPNSGPLHLQLGELAVALDQTAEAAEHFEKAQSLGEDGADLYLLGAACEVALSNREHAAELFGIALEIAPDRVSADRVAVRPARDERPRTDRPRRERSRGASQQERDSKRQTAWTMASLLTHLGLPTDVPAPRPPPPDLFDWS